MIEEEIEKAIEAHGAWKKKLRDAIDTGTSESTPEKVSQDNNCSFGKWLHERIDPEAKNDPHYPSAVELHAKFHKEAGKILALALDGKKDDATKGIAIGSDFYTATNELTKHMKDWRDSL